MPTYCFCSLLPSLANQRTDEPLRLWDILLAGKQVRLQNQNRSEALGNQKQMIRGHIAMEAGEFHILSFKKEKNGSNLSSLCNSVRSSGTGAHA